MTINLSKGERAPLTKDGTNPGIVTVGLGWNAARGGSTYDLDASAFICKDVGGDPHIISDSHFIYFGNKASPDGSVVHSGDNLTGDGDGDDEQIVIDFSKLPAECSEVSIVVTIYDAKNKGQNFGMVNACYVRAFGSGMDQEIKYDLADNFATATVVQFGSFFKDATGQWKFKAVTQGFDSTLAEVVKLYGGDA